MPSYLGSKMFSDISSGCACSPALSWPSPTTFSLVSSLELLELLLQESLATPHHNLWRSLIGLYSSLILPAVFDILEHSVLHDSIYTQGLYDPVPKFFFFDLFDHSIILSTGRNSFSLWWSPTGFFLLALCYSLSTHCPWVTWSEKGREKIMLGPHL